MIRCLPKLHVWRFRLFAWGFTYACAVCGRAGQVSYRAAPTP